MGQDSVIRIEGTQIIMELTEGEAKLAARLMPLLRPMLGFFLKIVTRLLFEMALMDKDRLDELFTRLEAGEEGILQKELFPNPESFEAFAKEFSDDFPGPGEIKKVLWGLD